MYAEPLAFSLFWSSCSSTGFSTFAQCSRWQRWAIYVDHSWCCSSSTDLGGDQR
jgi:hypothetical protein